MKKIVSVFLAVVLVVSMSSVAFAVDGENPDLSVVPADDVGSFGFPVSAVVDTSADVITLDITKSSLSSGQIAFLKEWAKSNSNVLCYYTSVPFKLDYIYFIIAPLSSTFLFSPEYVSSGSSGSYINYHVGCSEPCKYQFNVSDGWCGTLDYCVSSPFPSWFISGDTNEPFFVSGSYFSNVDYSLLTADVKDKVSHKKYRIKDNYGIFDNWSSDVSGVFPRVTVNYNYENGSIASPAVSKDYNMGDSYSISSPTIDGYYPSVNTVDGVNLSGNVSVNVIYKPIEYNLLVNYIYADGSEALPPANFIYHLGDEYKIVSPKISGFVPSPSFIRGTVQLNSSDMVFDVVYSPSLAIVSADDFVPFISGFIVGLTSLVATGLLLYIALLSVRLIPSIFEWFTKM